MLEVVDLGVPAGPWPSDTQVVVCNRTGAAANTVLLRDQPILGLIGPEGGFVPGEIPIGASAVSLSASVLRIETAAIAFAAVVRAPVSS
jgi:16S rRNA U1498 N3-methylase RsmE